MRLRITVNISMNTAPVGFEPTTPDTTAWVLTNTPLRHAYEACLGGAFLALVLLPTGLYI